MEDRLRRLEAVQSMLLEIGQLSTSCTDIVQFLRAVHAALGRIMYAANFYVALNDRDGPTNAVRFVYFVDEADLPPDPGEVITLASPDESPTAWVILNGQRLVMTAAEHLSRRQVASYGVGTVAEHWMGSPLQDQNHQTLGAIVIQSYDSEHTYSGEDQALFALIANHVSSALQGLQSMDRLERAVSERTLRLEHEVAERRRAEEAIGKAKASLEEQNAALASALTRLQQAQSELVRQEKLASLGRLVAGVAHEINTPLGICVTATSHLVQELKLTKEELAAGELDEEGLNGFFDTIDQSLRIMTTNTQRAAALVRSFKQVAVDQSSENVRHFNLAKYLAEVLLSLQPKLKGKPVKVEVDCPPDIHLDSFPGAVSQIVTNMVENSLVHGFGEDQAGTIRIKCRAEGEEVLFDYSDDGAGMDPHTLAQLFDPFFTTKRGSGGSGLGAHILYNLATGPLAGAINVTSAPGMGLHYQLRFPRNQRKRG
ncbi:phospho-acceptor domain-containing protein [Pseudoduganella lurida]|uniref:histidine kinase n=1 Tax=Pseudoduganella lurida TaxID=1036180 RepID=A0A562QWY5_9BURK|nr:GAF domain-containing sensor histidine kinase [Pseudoduganella lurida]TWI61113.1 phospho-acceptor domain-containing protein [Pseudoduganella lurida]